MLKSLKLKSLMLLLAFIAGGSMTAWADDYVKVASANDLTDGDYLIVYEDGNVAFDGSLETLDAVSNTITVNIANGVIASNSTTDASVFTINVAKGTIQSASGKYIGKTADSNGLDAKDTELTNTISIDSDGNADIESSGGAFLRFNNTSGQTRFRYYKSSSYTNQKAIQLYKKASGGEVDNRTATTVVINDPVTTGDVNALLGYPVAMVNDETGAPVPNATVTWESNNEEVASIGTYIELLAVGTARITATYAGDNNYKPSSASYTITVVDPNASGTLENPYTVEEAIAYIETLGSATSPSEVYVKGVVSQVDSYNSKYGSITYWISDDGTTETQMEVYSGLNLNKEEFTSVDDLQVGDEVTVCGTVKMYNSIPEFNYNNYLVAFNRPSVSVEAPEFSLAAGAYEGAQQVTITCATDDATIYYTTGDGDPDTKYTGAITISETTTIKAFAIKGNDVSRTVEATYAIVDTGNNSADNPFTVAEAKEFIDGLAGFESPMDVYVGGTISQVDSYANGNITYWISDDGNTDNQMEVYRGLGLDGEAFTAKTDLNVGDVVVVVGKVVLYNGSTYEFSAGSQLVSLEQEEKTYSVVAEKTAYSITSDAQEVNVNVTYTNTHNSGIYFFKDADKTTFGQDEDYTEFYAGILDFNFNNGNCYSVDDDGNVTVKLLENTTQEARSVYFHVVATKDDVNTQLFTDLITITQAAAAGQVDENVDVLTYDLIGVEGSSYSEWSGKTSNSGAQYAGQSAGGNKSIQLRSNNNNSGIVTTTTAGLVQSVTVTWNSNTTDGRTLNVYGKNSAYTDATDLYNSSTQGTLIGTIVCGGDTNTLTIDGSYAYIGLRSANGAMYIDKIEIAWDLGAVAPASIYVADNEVQIPSKDASGEIAVDYVGIDFTNMPEVWSCDIDGEPVDDYQWISVEINDNTHNLYYEAADNDGDERTAYFMVYGYDAAGGDVYSNIITITQKEFVQDYAEVPFEFNGVKADIEDTPGLTQEGLGSDYAEGNPRLKFDSTGDWLLLKFNDEPGELYFDIKSNKGNVDWDGTFTVQSSVDGVEFTDIAVYTPDNLSPDGYQTETPYLPRDVRYVKWIYTEKGAGNVGIGNIHLFEPDATIEIPVTEAGWATYVTPFALMFYAEEAYVVTSASTTSVQLEQPGMVCSGTPLLMKGTEGQETIISAYIGNNREFYAPETNLLKASDGKVKGDGATIYALANMETNGVGFYLVDEGVTIPAGKAYLEISDETAAEGARSFLAIGGDDTTGINAVEKALKQGTEVFDLQGRRVNKASKGLYIMNGQKVVIK